MTLFEAQCELEALKIDAQAVEATGRSDIYVRDRLNEIATSMRSLPSQINEVSVSISLPTLPVK